MPKLYQRICRHCSRVFSGGPRAWYCPECRKERKRLQVAAYHLRKRMGQTRELGSNDTCVVCGQVYVVTCGNQKYCPACAPEAVADIDRRQAMDYYAAHKEVYNDVRNKNRRESRNGKRICRICCAEFIGKEYLGQGCCSDACRKEWKRLLQAQSDARRYGKPVPTHPPPAKKIVDWTDVDWSLTNAEIARLKECRPQAVAAKRGKIKENTGEDHGS